MTFSLTPHPRAGSPAPGSTRSGWTLLLAAAAATIAAPLALQAQRTAQPASQAAVDSLRPDGVVKSVPLRTTGFDLFADADLAIGSIRDAGTFQNTITNRGGPGEAQIGDRLGNTQIGVFTGGGRSQLMFEQSFIMGTPPSEFRKIRAVHPGINNMSGSLGYTVQYQYRVSTPNILRVGPADGQFGNVFSGLSVAFGQGCRDDLNFLREGVSMLPMRDCPGTFGSQGFRGKLVVPDSIWLQRFNANKAGFRWNDWSIPAASLDQTQFLGTNSTYGFISDYNREQKLRYGGVVPGQAGPPTEAGYPLGLELRIDAWNFNSPATRNTQFYQVTMVNKSADVYGTGIDYDSLYFGTTPGFSWSSQNNHSAYFDFQTNTFYAMRAGQSGFCGAGRPRLYTNTTIGGCPASAGTGAAGAGIWTMTWLKSPLGDMRNKRFSNPNDPFYNPTSPLADDTITFNHSKPNGFGDFSQNLGRSLRSGFGMISSTEDNYLDGRNPSDFAINQFVYLFAPEQWSGTFPSAAEAKFNKFVPGSTTNPFNGQPYGRWDYNNDGVQDTISVPACGSLGCAAVYSDTIAGGYRNNYRNVLNTITAGPFRLRAGDTTQFLWAFSFADDTAAVRRNIEGTINSYLTNYEGPTPIAFPVVEVGKTYTVTSAELIDSLRSGVADASVGAQITIRLPQINAVDPYMTRLVARVRRDSAAGNARVLQVLRLNPGLLGRLEARARDNLSGVYIFKSCNNGNTFTQTSGNSATCTNAPTATSDDAAQAFPWRPWSRIEYTNGIPNTANVSEFVQAGRTYMFSFVTRTRGFRDFNLVDTSATGGYITSNVEAALGIPRDTINSPLAISGSSVVNIYAPITNTAGRTFAKVDTATVSGAATQPIGFAAVSNSVNGQTRVVWGNQFIVRKTIDTVTSATTTTISARYVLPRAATSPTATPTTNFVAREEVFTSAGNVPFSNAGTLLAGTFRNSSGSARVFVDTIASAAGQVGYVWVDGQNRPIFGINNQLGGNQARDQVGSPNYPGYIVQVRDSLGGSGFAQEEVKLPGNTGITLRERNFILRAPGDTLRGDAATFTPQVRPVNLAGLNQKRTRGGSYELTWQIDPWGPGAPFRLDPIANLQGAVNTSLQAVATAATTITETSARAATLAGATAARPLVRVRVPFTMTYRDTEGRSEPVRFAMLARSSNTRLLGSGADTIRVTIPDSLWMPGDTLFALHRVERDSVVGSGATAFTVVQPETIGGVMGFRPIPVLADSVGLSRFLVSCQATPGTTGVRPAADAATCNPLVLLTRGATATGGYLPVAAGWKQVFDLTRTFDPRSTVRLTATPFSSGNEVTKADLAKVSVVPNPYIVRGNNDELSGRTLQASRIHFTGVPEEGVLRIYSVSGQWLQELKWTKNDLVYAGNDAPSGDLPYNLRTREGTELSSGLYFYVLTATGPNGKDQVQRGKFVIIR